MRTDSYTADAICQSLGLASFDHDSAFLGATAALRLLLTPSFHPEVCLTFADGKVSVVCARSMIWHQLEPAPVLTDRAEACVGAESFTRLLASATPVVRSGGVPGLIIDGMPSELLYVRDGAVLLRAGGNASGKGDYSALVSSAINTAWQSISNPYCRNSLAEVAEYVSMRLPRETEPPRKPVVETMVLGTEEDRAQILEALRRHERG